MSMPRCSTTTTTRARSTRTSRKTRPWPSSTNASIAAGSGSRSLRQIVFAHAAERGWVWFSRDEAAVVHPATWQREGRPFKGMLVWSQRYHRAMSIGDVVRQIEALTEEDDPFAAGVRFIKP